MISRSNRTCKTATRIPPSLALEERRAVGKERKLEVVVAVAGRERKERQQSFFSAIPLRRCWLRPTLYGQPTNLIISKGVNDDYYYPYQP